MNAPGLSIVAVTIIVTSFAGEPAAILDIVQGKVVQPPATLVMVKLEGESVTETFVAVSVPKLLITIV